MMTDRFLPLKDKGIMHVSNIHILIISLSFKIDSKIRIDVYQLKIISFRDKRFEA